MGKGRKGEDRGGGEGEVRGRKERRGEEEQGEEAGEEEGGGGEEGEGGGARGGGGGEVRMHQAELLAGSQDLSPDQAVTQPPPRPTPRCWTRSRAERPDKCPAGDQEHAPWSVAAGVSAPP